MGRDHSGDIAPQSPSNRLEIAYAALFLLSNESSYVKAHTLLAMTEFSAASSRGRKYDFPSHVFEHYQTLSGYTPSPE
jgi:hypothetical protein